MDHGDLRNTRQRKRYRELLLHRQYRRRPKRQHHHSRTDLHAEPGRRLAAPTYTIWPSSAVPAAYAATSPTEVGVKFRSDSDGDITRIRFYKDAQNTGQHIGSLWPIGGGTALASTSFTGETASGWQQVTFPSPVFVTANTVYVASYHTNVGFSYTNSYFTQQATDSPPLHALQIYTERSNGVYTTGSTPVFPVNSSVDTNYWVDVVFSTSSGGGCSYTLSSTLQSVTSAASTGAVGLTAPGGCSWTASSNDSWITVTSGTPGSGNGSVGYSVTANISASQRTGSVTIAGQALHRSSNRRARPATYTIWSPDVVPQSYTATGTPVEMGVKFQTDVPGLVTGIRFYKHPRIQASTTAPFGQPAARASPAAHLATRPLPDGSS